MQERISENGKTFAYISNSEYPPRALREIRALGNKVLQTNDLRRTIVAAESRKLDAVFVDVDTIIPPELSLPVPTIALTSSKEPIVAATLLDSGMDRVLSKSSSEKVILAYVKGVEGTIIRRLKPERLAYQDLILDLPNHRLLSNAKVIHVSPNEFTMLKTLMEKPEEIHPKSELISRVWHGEQPESRDAGLRVYVMHLRQKLKILSSQVRIRNFHEEGYEITIK